MENLEKFGQHAHWLLRIALVSVFLYHAVGQFVALDAVAESLGLPAMATGFLPLTITASLLEFVGSILIIAGGFGKPWMTRLAGFFFIPVMLGAIFLFHIKHGWAKMELEFCLLMISIFFLLSGNASSKPARQLSTQIINP